MFQSTHLHEVWLAGKTGEQFLECFNPHTYMRCDLPSGFLHILGLRFQSTHLHEVWHTWFIYVRGDSMFQSTHLHEVWPSRTDSRSRLLVFQSTHLHEVWQLSRYLVIRHFCFNPHTYMRCDYASLNWAATFPVFQSTHLHEVWPNSSKLTFAWAGFNPHTYMRCDTLILLIRFIIISFNPHTYMRCDSGCCVASCCIIGFNPHTYMRCDGRHSPCHHLVVVSIHTPTWGVTVFRFLLFYLVLRFNPHTYMRCDYTSTDYTMRHMEFQSTHLHEVWQQWMICINRH